MSSGIEKQIFQKRPTLKWEKKIELNNQEINGHCIYYKYYLPITQDQGTCISS